MPGSGLDTKMSKTWSFFFVVGIHMVIEEPPDKVIEYLLEAPVVRAFPREAYAEGKMKKMQELL